MITKKKEFFERRIFIECVDNKGDHVILAEFCQALSEIICEKKFS